MLKEGTAKRSKADFDNAVDQLGASLSLSSGGGEVRALSRFFPRAFRLTGEALRSPALPSASLEKVRSQYITNLKNKDKDTKAISARAVNALAFGKSHPNGEFATVASIEGLSREDILQAYQKYITPDRAYLTIVGDITPDMAKNLVISVLGDWKGSGLKPSVPSQASDPAKTEIDMIDVPTAVQSEITIVNVNDLKLNDPEIYAAKIANLILGGGSDARLFKALREKRGFTYGAYSSVGTGKYQALFTASAAVRTAKTDSAITEFIEQIRLMRETSVTATELKDAKALYNGSFALQMENPSIMAAYARNILINNSPCDYYRNYLMKINDVTAEDVRQAARKYFSVGNSRIVVVGNTSDFTGGIKKLPYPVKKFDKEAEPIKE